MMIKSHYFSLIPISPWPILISLNLMSMFFSLSIFFKLMASMNLIISILIIFINSFFWWMFFSNELNNEGLDLNKVQMSIKMGMILFILSEVLFFFSFFWSYFHFLLSPLIEMSKFWPPKNLLMFEYSEIPMINTLILLTSGFTITFSHFCLTKNKMKKSIMFLMFTLILGFTFTLFQLKEYQSSFFSINDSNFGSVFFMLTGFHGLHVLIGSIFILTVLIRSNLMNLDNSENGILMFELSAWYWHFVDVVWLFLFYFVYFFTQ